MLRTRCVFYIQRRCKSAKLHWAEKRRKKTSTDRALEHFDDFYGTVFGLRWKNIRAALLSEHKYIAIVNNFGDTERTCKVLTDDGAVNVKCLVELAKKHMNFDLESQVPVSTHQLDKCIAEITKQKEQLEVSTIYPSSTENVHLPEKIYYRQDDDEANEKSGDDSSQNNADFNKSLHKSLSENCEIDYSRLVDPEVSTGALSEYIPASRIKGKEDWIPESDHYKYYQMSADFPLTIEKDTDLNYPDNLHLYSYEMGNCSTFKPPRKCTTGVLSHFLVDGASILPPLFLNIMQGERVLDACAAPGGKSLLMLQTLYPEILVCNDIQESRVNRIEKIMSDYLFDYHHRWKGKLVMMQHSDARCRSEYGSYDKILVDVPCTTDRHSLMVDDNNIFKPTRVKERLRLPELQAGILTNCVRLLRPGGTLIYSTCSLSPVQNDGVVHMALQRAFRDHNITVTIKDLSAFILLFRNIFRFERSTSMKYGQMVLPYLPANFGPMYFSKITRNQ